MHDGVTIFLSPELAKDLLLHKEEIVWHHHGMEARVSGTVVVGIEISKNGDTLRPVIISGPLMLQQETLDAVKQYKYKPCLLNGKPQTVATILSIAVSNY